MNGYTKITINGGEAGLKFAHLSHKLFWGAVAENPTFYADESGFNEIGWAKLLHTGHINYCAVREEKPALTLADFVDWIEGLADSEEKKKEFADAMQVYNDSQTTKAILKKIQEVSEQEGGKRKKKAVSPSGKS